MASAVPLSPAPPATAHVRARVPRARIGAFFAIALAIVTLLSVPFALGLLPLEASVLVVPVGQLAPLLAALLVRDRRVPARRALALAVPDLRMLLVACALAVLAFAAVPLLRLLLGAATGLAPVDPRQGILALAVAIPVVALVQTVLAVGEETGWRGWLHEALGPLGFWPASLLIGAMWALWHLPIVLATGIGAGGEGAVYLLTIVAVAPLLAALREAGGCVWPAVLGHGLLNSLRVGIDQGLAAPLTQRSEAALWIIEAAGWALWIVAALVVRCAGRRASRM